MEQFRNEENVNQMEKFVCVQTNAIRFKNFDKLTLRMTSIARKHQDSQQEVTIFAKNKSTNNLYGFQLKNIQ